MTAITGPVPVPVQRAPRLWVSGWRLLAAVLIVIGPIVGGIGGAMRVERFDDGDAVSYVAAHPGQLNGFLISDGLQLLVLPAFLLLALLVFRASPKLALLSGGLALVGSSATFVLVTFDLIARAAVNGDHVAADRVLDDAWSSGPVFAVGLASTIGMVASILVLATAVWRSRLLPRRVPVCLVATLGLGAVAYAYPIVGLAALAVFIDAMSAFARLARRHGFGLTVLAGAPNDATSPKGTPMLNDIVPPEGTPPDGTAPAV